MKESSLPQVFIQRVVEITLLAGLVIAPLVVVPVFTNFVVTSKLLFFFLSALMLVIAFTWKTIRTQAISIPRSPVILPLVLFGLASLASSLLTTPYPAENILGMGGVYLSTALIAVIGGQFLRNRSSDTFM